MTRRLDHLLDSVIDRFLGPDRSGPGSATQTKVAMLHLGRCGSTVLADLLKQHSDIYWDAEIFNGPAKVFNPNMTRKPDHKWCRSKYYPDQPLDFMASRSRVSNSPVYGFEMKYVDMKFNGVSMEMFADKLEELKFDHVIHLHRKNLLRRLISYLVAKERTQFHHKASEKSQITSVTVNVKAPYGPPYEPDTLVELFERQEREMAHCESLIKSKNILHLRYEEHIEAEPEKAYRLVCEFLGVSAQDVRVQYSRSTDFPLDKVLKNFDEVGNALRGTRYEWMLDS